MSGGPRHLEPLPGRTTDAAARGNHATPEHIWYAAFGSNMNLDRLAYYLNGGRPPSGLRTYPGCRDPRPPARSLPVMLPGSLYFALESRTWTGGMAFYDPDCEGEVPARAHLVTVSQFSDIAAQEMAREPGEDLDLSEVCTLGRSRMGEGRYETLVCPGLLDGHPVITFTAPWARDSVAWTPPAAVYLRHLAAGLAEAHGWEHRRIAEYLAACPGADGHWSTEAVAALLVSEVTGTGARTGDPGTEAGENG